MNDIMEEEYEINPSFQTQSSQNLEHEKKQWKKTFKFCILKKQWGSHMAKKHYVGFFCVWMITMMLMWNALKPWNVYFIIAI
jgi:hypothetical protein